MGELIMIDYMAAVSWIINNDCNLRCKHCYPESGPKFRDEKVLTREEIRKMGDSIKTVNPDMVFISGGEPFLCPNLFEYIEEAKRIANKEISMCTNGLFMTEENARKLKEAGMDCVSMSVCNPIPEKEDEFRGGTNIIQKVKLAAKRLKEQGIYITIDMTITTYNKDYIKEFVDLANSMEADVINFKRFRPMGRGKDNQWLTLTPGENKEVLMKIFEIASERPDLRIRVEDPLYALILEAERKVKKLPEYMEKDVEQQDSLIPNLQTCNSVSKTDKNGLKRYWGCSAGIEWVGIDHNGNVSPCPLLGYTGLTIGNVKEKNLIDILNNSNEIKKLREHYSNCKYNSICGGCRTDAYIATKDVLGKDPMCFIKNNQCYN
ncbi:MAG: radical SAM protein [Clostridiales bacterium]|nr:radical SAM protein [Clostridiales bacterium]